MSQTNDAQRMNLKGWIALGLLLAVSVDLSLTETYSFRLPFELFLPLATAVIAHRYGLRVFGFLFVMVVPTVVTLEWFLNDRVTLQLHIPQWSFLLSVAVVFVFCREPTGLSADKLLNARWRVARWLVPVAVWLMLHYKASIDFEPADWASVHVKAGSVLLLVILLASVRWAAVRTLLGRLRNASPGNARHYGRIAMLALLATGLLANVSIDDGYIVAASLAFSDGNSLLLLFTLFAVAMGAVDWRLAVVIIAALLVSEANIWRLYEFFEEPRAPPQVTNADDSGLQSIVISSTRVTRHSDYPGYSGYWYYPLTCTCFAILGLALRRSFAERSPVSLGSRHCLALLALASGILLVAVPLTLLTVSPPAALVMAVTALAIGYRWRMRGLFLGPAALQFAYLTGVMVLAPTDGHPASALYAIDIGLIAFLAAFFGMLLNREATYEPDANAPRGMPP